MRTGPLGPSLCCFNFIFFKLLFRYISCMDRQVLKMRLVVCYRKSNSSKNGFSSRHCEVVSSSPTYSYMSYEYVREGFVTGNSSPHWVHSSSKSFQHCFNICLFRNIISNVGTIVEKNVDKMLTYAASMAQ